MQYQLQSEKNLINKTSDNYENPIEYTTDLAGRVRGMYFSPDFFRSFCPCVRRASDGEWKTLLLYWDQFLVWSHIGVTGAGGNRERLLRELDHLKAHGINNLRVLVGADGKDGILTKVEPALQIEAGVYNDTIFDGLDYFLSELGKRDMYAVLFLNNSWEWSGGYSQYLYWAGHGEVPMPNIAGWDAFSGYVAQYAKSEKAHRLFRNHVTHVVNRVNRYTGKKYSEDPAIMSWQIGMSPVRSVRRIRKVLRRGLRIVRHLLNHWTLIIWSRSDRRNGRL